MNVVVVAPHPDDEAIGCGGAIALHSCAGDRVTVVFLSSGEAGLAHLPQLRAQELREKEASAACVILGVHHWHFLRHPDSRLSTDALEGELENLLRRYEPELIYAPHPKEWHPDHKAAAQAALAVTGTDRRLLGYEVWTPLERYHCAKDITPVMNRKLRAIRSHNSQLHDLRYDRAIRGLNQYRGAFACRSRFAEVFESLDVAASVSDARGFARQRGETPVPGVATTFARETHIRPRSL